MPLPDHPASALITVRLSIFIGCKVTWVLLGIEGTLKLILYLLSHFFWDSELVSPSFRLLNNIQVGYVVF